MLRQDFLGKVDAFAAQVGQRLTWWAGQEFSWQGLSASLHVRCVLEVLGKIIYAAQRKGHWGIAGFRAPLPSVVSVCLDEVEASWERTVRHLVYLPCSLWASRAQGECALWLQRQNRLPGFQSQLCPSEQWLLAHEPAFCTAASPAIEGADKDCKSFSALWEELDKLKHLNQSGYSWHIVNAQYMLDLQSYKKELQSSWLKY